jgi:hypothetical protein
MRVMAPLVGVTSPAVLVSGVALLLVGPGHGQLLTIHKLSFIVWFVAMTVHVLGHLLRHSSRGPISDGPPHPTAEKSAASDGAVRSS